ncbi:hypothetical protein [Thomasclavelia cocleata]|uniref:Uncharacterized protein n=2 Tax=Thomasclavelia cocleata TaxID=69824 RepID=A0A829ZF20_9FIRM|nr:hypothetical protein [Thomasclavelia cocleata]GFI41554.1 hypothetical protein IMSAGC017_01599 [Thomasclavelia cocleata]
MLKYQNVFNMIMRYIILGLWCYFEFVTTNNYLLGVVYEEVFPNGFSESEKLSIDFIPDVINTLSYVLYFLVILYAIILIYIYIKENNVWNYLKNIMLLVLGFIVILQAKFITFNIYDMNDLAHFKWYMYRLFDGCVIVLLIYLYRRWKKYKLSKNSGN